MYPPVTTGTGPTRPLMRTGLRIAPAMPAPARLWRSNSNRSWIGWRYCAINLLGFRSFKKKSILCFLYRSAGIYPCFNAFAHLLCSASYPHITRAYRCPLINIDRASSTCTTTSCWWAARTTRLWTPSSRLSTPRSFADVSRWR